jgi:hypothetical protein
LGGFARGAAVEEREVRVNGLRIEEIFRMCIEPGAVPVCYMEQKKFGGEGVRGDTGFAKEAYALF